MTVKPLSPVNSVPALMRACQCSLSFLLSPARHPPPRFLSARVNNVRARQRTVTAEGRAVLELGARQRVGGRSSREGGRISKATFAVGVRDREAVVARVLRACACVTCARTCKRVGGSRGPCVCRVEGVRAGEGRHHLAQRTHRCCRRTSSAGTRCTPAAGGPRAV